jgi:hypothetical protein
VNNFGQTKIKKPFDEFHKRIELGTLKAGIGSCFPGGTLMLSVGFLAQPDYALIFLLDVGQFRGGRDFCLIF